MQSIARSVMRERGLQPDFSPAALQQAQTATTAAAAPGPGVRDLTTLLWASIDNDDSRDLDQLTVAAPGSGGATKILVAIADVDALVAQGSAIDAHARTNTTSVYTAAQVFPMLPERLSTDLTSLGEGIARASLVVEMSVGTDGAVGQSDIYRALVLNRAKLAYNSVGAWLAGAGPVPARVAGVPGLDAQLRLQDEIAQRLKQARHDRGALTLMTNEAHPVFERGVLTDMEPDTANSATDLIEDFMIAANAVVARYFEGKGLPSLRRVLRTPERWDRIVALAAGLGVRLPASPDGVALNDFLAHSRDSAPERFGDVSLAVIKLLGRGEYVLQRPGASADGHFGLAVRDYAHSTA
ncbi:MAG TPA: ribonuclease catalytic domain-containing protein, partial [Steroidobacteraceae bacterium]|nr:ribonuclease catalytic domain-containing protein [Steroidobacteraceae bacterium]